MYVPDTFRATAQKDVFDAVERYPFGTLITTTPDGTLQATHLPFLLDRRRGAHGTLLGHLARANPQASDLAETTALVIFQGPHGYVSASWYETESALPTWNYVAVHATGRPQVRSDEEFLLPLLRRTVDRFEADQRRPWVLDTESDYVRHWATAVVGFTIPVDRLDAGFKLSQNINPELRKRVARGIETRGEHDDADLLTEMAEKNHAERPPDTHHTTDHHSPGAEHNSEDTT